MLGESFLDVWHVGEATRLSPEGPFPVVSIDQILKIPGGAANVGNNLAALGAYVQPLLSHAGVKNRLVAGGHQLARWDERDGSLPFAETPLADALPLGTTYDAVVISDYGKGLVDETFLAFLERFSALPFFIDTKAAPSRFNRFPNCTFFPNAKEYRQHKDDYSSLKQPFVLKRGAEGMEYWAGGADGPVYFAKALARAVGNVTGAGDSTLAAWTVSYLQYQNPRAALAFAAASAACAVEQQFTSAPTLSAVHAKLLEGRGKR